MTNEDDLFDRLSGLTPAEITDLLKGLSHHRQRAAADEGAELLAALFEQQDRTTTDMIAALNEHSTEQDTE